MDKAIRQSNFELLRIFAMLSIVIGHCISQTHCIDYHSNLVLQFGGYFVGSFARISVNIFLLIGVYFLVDSTFKPSKILRLYGEIWFYTVLLYFFIKSQAIPISLKDTLDCFFPFLGSPLWFITTYLGLMLTIPFLKPIINLNKTKLQSIEILLFILIPFMSTLHFAKGSWFDNYCWFVYLYIFMGYFKKYILTQITINKYLVLSFALVVYLALVLVKVYLGFGAFLTHFQTIPNFFISLCVFYFFYKTDVGQIKSVNTLAQSVLAVYIIHQTPCFIDYLWQNICHCSFWIKSNFFVLYAILSSVFIFIAVTAIDYIRIRFIEPFWFKSKLFQYIEKLLINFYSKFTKEVT